MDGFAYLGVRDELDELLRGTGLTEEDEKVVLAHNADVTVKGIGGVEEHGLGPRGDESHGNLLGDEAGLADAAEEDGALAVEDSLRKGRQRWKTGAEDRV